MSIDFSVYSHLFRDFWLFIFPKHFSIAKVYIHRYIRLVPRKKIYSGSKRKSQKRRWLKKKKKKKKRKRKTKLNKMIRRNNTKQNLKQKLKKKQCEISNNNKKANHKKICWTKFLKNEVKTDTNSNNKSKKTKTKRIRKRTMKRVKRTCSIDHCCYTLDLVIWEKH